MLKGLIGVVAGAAILVGAAASQSGDASVVATDASWHLIHDGEMAKLAYGMAQSDNIAMMAACENGSDRVALYGDVRPLDSLDAASAGPSAPDPLSSGDAVETVVALERSGLMALSDAGHIRVRGDGDDMRLTATPAERDAVSQFLAYCRSSLA